MINCCSGCGLPILAGREGTRFSIRFTTHPKPRLRRRTRGTSALGRGLWGRFTHPNMNGRTPGWKPHANPASNEEGNKFDEPSRHVLQVSAREARS
jgi:hypothetical protein